MLLMRKSGRKIINFGYGKGGKMSHLGASFLMGILYVCLMGISPVFAQTNEPASHRVYVTANTADLEIESPFYQDLRTLLAQSDAPFTLVLNGDLVRGKHHRGFLRSDTIRIQRLLEAAQGLNGRVLIIPGDRDWAESGRNGWERVRALQLMVESWNYDHVDWIIENGCPGPQTISLTPEVTLLAIQTQWWNHPHDKPLDVDAVCSIASEEDFLEEFDDVIEESLGKNILMVGHYPVFSFGEYGGRMPLKKHIFPLTDIKSDLYVPLPVIGSLYSAFRQNVGTPKDIVNKHYRGLRKHLEEIISDNQSLIYLSGHEQNMQIIRQGNNYYINSGSAAYGKFAGKDRSALFSEPLRGVMEITYFEDGDIFARIHRYQVRNGFELFTERYLFQSVCNINDSIVPVNTISMFCGDGPDGNKDGAALYDSTIATIAGYQYAASKIRRLFFGRHYRDSWTAPIPVSYLNLDTVAQGLRPLKKGGGTQTLALRFQGANGREYNFRSVDKHQPSSVDFDLRGTVIGYVLRDQTSTQHPYGALVADPLMDALDILHVRPHLYMLPNDPKLGQLRGEYGDLLGMLEENPKSPTEVSSNFAGADSVARSYRLFRILYQNQRAKVDDKAFARARIFDMYVGDWDRHEDNWKWAGFASGDSLTFLPIPRDRDHIFSRWDGLVPWVVDREWVRPYGENFGRRIRDVQSLTFKARHLDRFLLSELTREDWLKEARYVQETMTDSLIDLAIQAFPPQIQEISGGEIAKKLKSRRERLDQDVLRFYKLLSHEVDIVGTNQAERVEVDRNHDGTVTVSMYEEHSQKDGAGRRIFRRTFLPGETKEIRLFGLDGEDTFTIRGSSRNSIRLRIIGGPGNDRVREESTVNSVKRKTLIYEKDPGAKIQMGREGRMVRVANNDAYNFHRAYFKYDRYFPFPLINFNGDDGFLMTAGFRFYRNTYGKSEYSSGHLFRGTYSTAGALSLNYYGVFREVIRRMDVEVEAEVADPSRYFFFFGTGNESSKEDTLFTNGFYRTRYSSYNLALGLKVDFWKRSRVGLHLRYENNEAQIPDNTILFLDSDLIGVDKANMLSLRGEVDIDLRDNPNFPDKGMRVFMRFDNGILTTNNNSNYGQSLLFLEGYSTLRTYLPLTFAFKAGVGDSYGDIPFYRQFTLGHKSFLRGYRRNRFTGDGISFANTEVRLELLKKEHNVIPFRLGLKGFFDAGRIQQDGEDSRKVHLGYGWGFYFIPFTEEVALNVSFGYSEEETSFFKFSIGTTFR